MSNENGGRFLFVSPKECAQNDGRGFWNDDEQSWVGRNNATAFTTRDSSRFDGVWISETDRTVVCGRTDHQFTFMRVSWQHFSLLRSNGLTQEYGSPFQRVLLWWADPAVFTAEFIAQQQTAGGDAAEIGREARGLLRTTNPNFQFALPSELVVQLAEAMGPDHSRVLVIEPRHVELAGAGLDPILIGCDPQTNPFEGTGYRGHAYTNGNGDDRCTAAMDQIRRWLRCALPYTGAFGTLVPPIRIALTDRTRVRPRGRGYAISIGIEHLNFVAAKLRQTFDQSAQLTARNMDLVLQEIVAGVALYFACHEFGHVVREHHRLHFGLAALAKDVLEYDADFFAAANVVRYLRFADSPLMRGDTVGLFALGLYCGLSYGVQEPEAVALPHGPRTSRVLLALSVFNVACKIDFMDALQSLAPGLVPRIDCLFRMRRTDLHIRWKMASLPAMFEP